MILLIAAVSALNLSAAAPPPPRAIVDTERGLWEYEVATGTPMYESIGAVTWMYDGQATFTSQPTPEGGRWDWVEPDDADAADPFARLLSATRVDSEGRRWKGVAYDPDKAYAALARYDEQFPDEETVPPENGDWLDRYVGVIGEARNEAHWEYSEPYSWHHYDCPTTPPYNAYEDIWASESRTVVTTLDVQQYRTVTVQFPDGGECSGSLVASDWVLTSMHCVLDANGYLLDMAQYKFCNRGNVGAESVCRTGAANLYYGSYAPNTAAGDWALMRVTGGSMTTANAGFFPLSGLADASLDGLTALTTGFPAYTETTCVQNTATAYHPGYYAAQYFHETDAVQNTSNSRLGTFLDATSRQSGSPIWYNGSAPGNFPQIGILSRQYTPFPYTTTYVGGPKIPSIKADLVNWMGTY